MFIEIDLKNTIETGINTEILAQIATIISLLVAVISYWHSFYIKKQNQKMIKENAIEEIKHCKNILERLKEDKQGLITKKTIFLYKYNYANLEKIVLFENSNLRKQIFYVVNELEKTNKRISDYNLYTFTSTESTKNRIITSIIKESEDLIQMMEGLKL